MTAADVNVDFNDSNGKQVDKTSADAWRVMEEQLKALIATQQANQRAMADTLAEQVAILSRMSEYSPVWNEHQIPPATPDMDQVSDIGMSSVGRRGTAATATPFADRETTDIAVQHEMNYSAYELAEAGGKDWRREDEGVVHKKTTFREEPAKWMQTFGKRLLNSRVFEPCMGLFIILNAMNIGWAIDQELRNYMLPEDQQVRMLTIVFEHVLLGVFTLELLLRMYVEGVKSCLSKAWNFLDFVLVGIAYVELVAQMIIKDLQTQGVFKQVLVLRMLRILRLARAVRLVKKFKSLWNLCQGLLKCWGTMFSAFTLMLGSTFLFGCFGAEVITKTYRNDPVLSATIEDRFSTMPKIMLTLFQFITMDSIAQFYWELILRQPYLIVYFILLVVVVSIALMNLITAMLVEEAIMNQRMDEEMAAYYTRRRLKELEPQIRSLFSCFDSSGDGNIHVGEVLAAMESGMKIPKELQTFVNHARIVDLFDALDKDQSGHITEDEFVEGLGYMAMSDVPLETMQILHLVRSCTRELVKLKKELRSSSPIPAALKAVDIPSAVATVAV